MIPFNRPFVAGNELRYVQDAIQRLKISGDGHYTEACHRFFEARGFSKVLLTTSCTDALEMSALLANIQPGDEVIVPSFTFVSTANAFELRGAKVVFADSSAHHPNMDVAQLESLMTERTKAVVPVHYAGEACDMDALMALAQKHDLMVIEDAAQAVDSFYNGRPLGTIGALAAFSFHETKNISCGEGGMLAVNDAALAARAEVLRDKGTNRSQFLRGQVDKYEWVDVGSSFLPSDMLAAYLLAQLEQLEVIQQKRKALYDHYKKLLQPLADSGHIQLPQVPDYATRNGQMFYLLCRERSERQQLMAHLRTHKVSTAFHYQPLHRSPYFAGKHDGRALPNADRFADGLLRLPLFFELTFAEQEFICGQVAAFFH